jgi:hypothetical protein
MSVPYEGDSSTVKIPGLRGRNTAPQSQETPQHPALGVEGISDNGEAVRGESSSQSFAAVHGIALNPSGTGAGTYGESRGKGVGVLGVSQNSGDPTHLERKAPPLTGVAGLTVEGVGVLGVCQDPSHVNDEIRAPSAFIGVVGLSLNPNTTNGAGVHGVGVNCTGVTGETNSLSAPGVSGFSQNQNGTGAGVFGQSLGAGPAGFFTAIGSGPALSATSLGPSLAGSFQGDVLVTGNFTATKDIFLPGADCAEQFDIAGAAQLEPGTVVVIDGGGALRESREPYDKKVAGVVSGAGDYRPGIVLDQQASQVGRVVIALLGKVYCKVDAQYSPIEVGDLLTTSPTAGCAMKVADGTKAFGAVIGKALRPIAEGQALIPILIALQ